MRKIHLTTAMMAVAVVVFMGSYAMAQQTYTNADLGKLHIPGAYTNQDLKALVPLPVQKAPLFEYPEVDLSKWIEEAIEKAAVREVEYHGLVHERDRYQAELDYELERLDLEVTYSLRDGGFTGFTRPLGLRSEFDSRLKYLRRQIFLLNWEIARQ